MKFKASLTNHGIQILEKRFLHALDKVGKTWHVYLTPDHFIFLHNLLSFDGIQSVAQFSKQALFSDYRIASQTGNRIAFTLEMALFYSALRGSASICAAGGANGVHVRLAKKQTKSNGPNMPFLTFETQGGNSTVIHDVPISSPLSPGDIMELQSALESAQEIPPTLVQVPDLAKMQNFVERHKNIGDILKVSVTQYGDLLVEVATTLAIAGAAYCNLGVLGVHVDAPAESQAMKVRARMELALERGEALSVELKLKHFAKSLQCCLAEPDSAFLGIAPQAGCLTVIFQFFIPGTHQNDKSISLHCRLPVIDT
ncbi:hypothetical protein Sjap_012130 [Stephania japonica]|uniref:Checkpoint protein n=1 Tax=Stephania japonica TaxID=461633 RepID=A0AAP0NXB1_9MAGN